MILSGLTLVVSPLLSLMVDQLRKLPAFLPGGLLASSQVNKNVYIFFAGSHHTHSYVDQCVHYFMTQTSDEFHETLQRLRGGDIKVHTPGFGIPLLHPLSFLFELVRNPAYKGYVHAV